jgi:protein phosphatase
MVAMNFMDKKDIKPGTVMGTGKPG